MNGHGVRCGCVGCLGARARFAAAVGAPPTPMLILRDERGFELEQPDFGGVYFAHDTPLPDGGSWRTLYRDSGGRAGGKRVLVAEGPSRPPPAIAAPPARLTVDDLARALFDTDLEVEAFVMGVVDGNETAYPRALDIAWDRDERGWRCRAWERAQRLTGRASVRKVMT